MADPTAIKETVNAGRRGEPKSAIPRVRQVMDPVQPFAHYSSPAVVFQKLVAAACDQFTCGEASENKDTGIGVAVGGLERI